MSNTHRSIVWVYLFSAYGCGSGEHIVGENYQGVESGSETSGEQGSKDSSTSTLPGVHTHDDHGDHDESPATGTPLGQPSELNTCPPVPGNPLSFSYANSDHPVRWETEACIDVTYAEGAKAQAELTYASLQKLTELECLGLCFSPPTPGPAIKSDAESESRRIHVRLVDDLSGPPFLPALTFRQDGGEILFVELLVAQTHRYPTPQTYMHEAAHSLGADHSADPASPLYALYNPEEPTKELTSEDVEAICAVYEGRAQSCE